MEGARWDIQHGSITESKLKELFPIMPVVNIRVSGHTMEILSYCVSFCKDVHCTFGLIYHFGRVVNAPTVFNGLYADLFFLIIFCCLKMSTSLELVSFLAGDVAHSISYQLGIYGIF